MLTAEQIAALRDKATKLVAPIQAYLLREIVRRVAHAGQLTSTAAYQVWKAQQMGVSQRQIKQELRRMLKLSHKEIRRIMYQSAQSGYNLDVSRFPQVQAVPFEKNTVLQQIVSAASELAEAAGDSEKAKTDKARLAVLRQRYVEFSRDAGLRTQYERTEVAGFGERRDNSLENSAKSGILSDTISIDQSSEVPGVHKVCDLDIKKFQCVTPDIRTSEVIITDERIEHIRQRHPEDFERYSGYLKEIIEKPDYIIEDPRPGTAMLLKEIREQNERFRLALRLITPTDNPDYKNSIITFMKIREKEWQRVLRNKKILYKSE